MDIIYMFQIMTGMTFKDTLLTCNGQQMTIQAVDFFCRLFDASSYTVKPFIGDKVIFRAKGKTWT